jgi:hypothetical protein
MANYGAFTQLWKVSLSFVMSTVCREQSDSHSTDIHEISHLGLVLIFIPLKDGAQTASFKDPVRTAL